MSQNETPVAKEKESKVGCIFFAIFIAAIIIVGIVSMSYNSNGGSDQNISAWVCAQKAVEDTLKSPSTAKFCSYTDASIQNLGGDKYHVSGYVDAQNSYGATLRKNFTVTLTLTSQGFTNSYVEID